VQRALAENASSDVLLVAMYRHPESSGRLPPCRRCFRAIGRLAHSHATVLITGESGSGKELVAQALHRHSPRASGAFIALNTAAIPKDLLESELFGHERGAFTGAAAQRRGALSRPTAARCFWMKSATCPLNCKPACCACCRMASFIGWVVIHPSR